MGDGWQQVKSGNGYFWNTAAGFLNAGEAVVLSMVVTRTSGLADAGILSIAFAVGNLMMTIGKFGVRSYQVTDVEERFSFSEYFHARIVTTVLMCVISLVYLFYCIQVKGYNSRKTVIILSFILIYTVESLEDVFWGLYQLRQVLDAGAKLFMLRWTAILSVCILILVFTDDLFLASILGFIVCLAVFCIYNTIVFRSFQERIERVRSGFVWQILCQCFPLFLASFMTIYVTNAPKYAIDRYFTEEVQACYGFIAMPVFVVELLNGFLYQPSLVHMAMEWKEHRIDSFRRRVKRQCLVLFGLSGMCLFGAYFCGIPILSVMYNTELSSYKAELLVLLCGGGMLAYAGYFSVLLTIMRKQRTVMYGYVGVSLLSFMLSNGVVKDFGVIGAAVFYMMLMTLLAGFFCITCWWKISRIFK